MSNFPLPISKPTVAATKTVISEQPCEVDGWQIVNQTAAEAFVQVFDKKSGDVTVGQTTPDWWLPLPISGGAAVGLPKSIQHSSGLVIACTTTWNGSSGANCDVTFFVRS